MRVLFFKALFGSAEQGGDGFGFDADDFGDFPAGEAAGIHEKKLAFDGLEAGDDVPDAAAFFFGEEVVERVGRVRFSAKLFAGDDFFAAEAAGVGAKSIEGEVDGGAVEPGGRVFMRRAALIETAEGVGGEFFGVAAVAGEAKERADEAWVVFGKEFFESGAGFHGRESEGVADAWLADRWLKSRLHTCNTARRVRKPTGKCVAVL